SGKAGGSARAQAAAAGGVWGGLPPGWAGGGALGGAAATDKFIPRHCGVVAVAESCLDDARVAAVAILVAGAQHVKKLLHHADIANFRNRSPARMKPASFAQGDQLFHDWAQILCLRQRRRDLLMLDQRRA